jgi:hypothetical protein
MEKLIIKNSRRKYLRMLIGSMGFVGGGIWMVIDGVLLGWICILFFGFCSLSFIWQIADPRPRLIIDEQGVLDRTLGVGRIAWSDIKAAYLRSIHGNDFICLELRNAKKYKQKLSQVRRSLAGANRDLGFTDFHLNLSGVDASTDEVIELIMKYCRVAVSGRRTTH